MFWYEYIRPASADNHTYGARAGFKRALEYIKSCPFWHNPVEEMKKARWYSCVDKLKTIIQWWWCMCWITTGAIWAVWRAAEAEAGKNEHVQTAVTNCIWMCHKTRRMHMIELDAYKFQELPRPLEKEIR